MSHQTIHNGNANPKPNRKVASLPLKPCDHEDPNGQYRTSNGKPSKIGPAEDERGHQKDSEDDSCVRCDEYIKGLALLTSLVQYPTEVKESNGK